MNLTFKNFVLLNEQEKKDILNLRNQDYIRENMVNSEIISLENHLSFIDSLRGNINKKYFAIFADNKLIGSVNFTIDSKLSWGLYFADTIDSIIKSASSYLFIDYIFKSFDKTIYAFVKNENLRSLNFHKRFGFEIYKEDNIYTHLKLSDTTWQKAKNLEKLEPTRKYLETTSYEFRE